MIVMMLLAFYLVAIGTQEIDAALKGVERIGSWPVQALNIGLFVLVLGICWLYLQQTRRDLAKLQAANDSERREYIESLRTVVSDTVKVVERNNLIFERVDRRLERLENRGSGS